jgi:methyl-accepting chemotaxis protein
VQLLVVHGSDPAWTVLTAVAVAAQLGLAVVASLLAARAVRHEHTFERTDPWDGTASAAHLALIVVGTFVTGGATSPLWFAALLPAAYLANAWVARLGEASAAVLAVAAAASAAANGQFSDGGLAYALAVTIGMPALFLLVMLNARGLYADTEQRAFEREILRARVADLSHLLERAEAGDLDVAGQLAEAAGEDDVTDDSLLTLARAFDATLRSLRDLVEQVRASGLRIAGSTADMLAVVQDHAAVADQQSAAAIETTTSMQELAATADQIALTAEAVALRAAVTLDHVGAGQEAVAESVAAMATLSRRAEQIETRAEALGAMGDQIGSVVAVIDELADQTNLLALNAAIEAARAGEHGSGFAVVAAEVSRLAERSRSSAGEIESLVGRVRAETTAAIADSQEGAREAATGRERVQGMATVLEQIAGMVDENTAAATEISVATEQQRVASRQVAAAMSQVSEAARASVEGSGQATAAASELDALTRALQDAIVAFRYQRVAEPVG